MTDIMQKSVIGGEGYRSLGQPSVDIMGSRKSSGYTLQDVFNNGTNSIIPGFAQNDTHFDQTPVLGDNQPSALGAMAQDQKVDLSVGINTASMMRDGNQAITDGANVAAKRENGQQEVSTKMAQAQQMWDGAKGQAIECLKEAAAESSDPGVNPSTACDSIVAPESTSCKVSAAGATGGQVLAAGMGSLATAALGISYVAVEASSASKDLDAKQQKDLVDAAYQKSQLASRSISDAPTGIVASAESVIAPDQPDLSCLNRKQFEELLTTRLDQQPEYAALEQKACDLDNVKENHQYAAGIYADRNLSEKMVAAADGGNALAQGELNNSLVYTTGVKYDSIDAVLASNWLAELKMPGAGLAAKDVGFAGVNDVETRIDMTLVNTPALVPELTNNLHQQLRV